MATNTIIEGIISRERLQPYEKHHSGDIEKALAHYKANMLISESFYPILSVLEVGLRNSIDTQLARRYGEENRYESTAFVSVVSNFQTKRISEARASILKAQKEITTGRIVSELTFGFWTSLFDTKFELTLWKYLRLAFPNYPKESRQRKIIGSKLNKIRKFRNRIFHHEAISWNIVALDSYKRDIVEAINWLDKDLLTWIDDLNHVDRIIESCRNRIEQEHSMPSETG